MKEISIELTLPEEFASARQMVEAWGMHPRKAEDVVEEYDFDRIRAKLTYGYGGYVNLDCIKAAAAKVWGEGCSFSLRDNPTYDSLDFGILEDAGDGIVRIFERFCYVNDPSHAKAKVERFAKKWSLTCRNGFIFYPGVGEETTEDIIPCGDYLSGQDSSRSSDTPVTEENGENRLTLYINNIEGVQNHHFSEVSEEIYHDNSPATQEAELYVKDRPRGEQHYKWDEMISNCQLAFRFEAGEYYVNDITWGLMTNYISVYAGQDRFMNCIAGRQGYNDEMKAEWLYQIRRAKEAPGYKPTGCDKYCPYCESCNRQRSNLLGQVLKPGQARKLYNTAAMASRKEIAMETAEQLTEIFIKESLTEQDDPNTIYVLKIPTGVGKTANILSIEDAVVAIPNHDLADEIAERMAKAGNDVIRVGSPPADYSPEFISKINILHKVGAHHRAAALIADEVKLLRKKKTLSGAEEEMIRYADSLSWLDNGGKQTAVVTHKRALHMRRNYVRAVTVFDEDPLCESINQDQALMSDLTILKNAAIEKADRKVTRALLSIIRRVENAEHGLYEQTPVIDISKPNEIVDFVLEHAKSLDSNVLGLLQAEWFIKVGGGNSPEIVHYASRPRLPQGRVVVLSATADEQIYRDAFPDRRVVFREIGPVQAVGIIRQCVNATFSKQMVANLKKNNPEKLEALFEAVKHEVGDRPVITYKNLEDDAKKAGLNVCDKLHYGKVVGSNLLQDDSICVLGTFGLNPIAYKLLALCLGIRFTMDDQQMRYQRVQHNGYEFYMVVFDDPKLRAIQLWRIESELLQAVGRARHLRKANTVTVFASLPIDGAEIFTLKLAA